MRRHVMMSDGDVESCVHCGREPWMASFAMECAGPHPTLVQLTRDDLLGGFGWRDVAAWVGVTLILATAWSISLSMLWGTWKLIR